MAALFYRIFISGGALRSALILDCDGARWIEELPAGLAAQQGPAARASCLLARPTRTSGGWWCAARWPWLLAPGSPTSTHAVGVSEERFFLILPAVCAAVTCGPTRRELPPIAAQGRADARADLCPVCRPESAGPGRLPRHRLCRVHPDVVVLYHPDALLAVPVREQRLPLRRHPRRSASGPFRAGARWATWASTSGAAPRGRRWNGCTRR